MAFQFDEERRIEYWLRPFTAQVLLPGYRRVMLKETRIFWESYWSLLRLGLTEQQLADYAVEWACRMRPLPHEMALVQAVMFQARCHRIELPQTFNPPTSAYHPRDMAARLLS